METKAQQADTERRGAERWKVFEIAGLSNAQVSVPAVVDDLSETGAAITTEQTYSIGEEVFVEIEGFERLSARVVHVRGSYVGLQFEMTEPLISQYKAWLATIEKEDR